MVIPAALWGLTGAILALISLVPYVVATLRGTNKPHIFTWIIWAILTGVAFAVQVVEGAGPGAWSTGITSALCFLISVIAIRHGEKHITRMDWACFILALAALPIWLATDNPAAAVVWVTLIDALAYIPTLRKVWHKPHEEMLFTPVIANVKHVFSLLGMVNYSIATCFYPVSLLLFNGTLALTILLRRRIIARAAA